MAQDRYQKLDYSEIWLRDGFRCIQSPGFFISNEVDMSLAKSLMERLNDQPAAIAGKVTYTHLFVRAAAIALSENPDLHQMFGGRKRLSPGSVDIGLSVAGSAVAAPILVVRNAEQKTVSAIAVEVGQRAPGVIAEQERQLARLRKWGWLVPFGLLRRLLVRAALKRLAYVRRSAGTFQLTCSRNTDHFVPFLFSHSAIMATGVVRERAVVVDGEVMARPTVVVSCCVDHKAWDGLRAARFLSHVKNVLESAELGLQARDNGTQAAPVEAGLAAG